MKLKQLLAALLCFALLACCAPIALAAEDTATVTFWYANGSEIQTALDLTVSDGTAEDFGFTPAEKDHNGVPVETVTVLDVLAAAHKTFYGDDFTKETAAEYLVADGGFITKAFGVETYNMGFAVNDATPHDDQYLESSWGDGYTGYACDAARVKDGDRVCLYMYKDLKTWADVLPQFEKTSLEAEQNKAFTLSVSGYSIMSYGFKTQDVIDKNTKPLEGVTVESTQDFKTFTTVGTLDKDGKLSVTLPQTGTYYLVVRGMFDDPDLDKLPLIASFCKVDVKEAAPDTSKAKYFPIGIRPIFRFADYTLTLGLDVTFRDLKKTAPDKTETYSFTISLKFLEKIFK